MVPRNLLSRRSHRGLCTGRIQLALALWLGLLSCFSWWSHVESATNPQDINALKALHIAWNKNPFSWDTKSDPCDTHWLGVLCDSTSTHVTQLLLINQGLDGLLPLTIGDLTNLTDLDLSSNPNLRGSIPSTISNLKNIKNLYLQFCNFWGLIPPEIGNLTKLISLGLTQNSLSGSLPDTIGLLSNLRWFDASSNNLNGSLPDSTTSGSQGGLGNLTLVKHIHLQNNSFWGSIPTSIFNKEMQLQHLLLNNNELTGTIPTNVGDLLHLQIMRLDNNALSGSIPTSISTMQGLTTLQLDHNQLIGQLLDLSNCTNLQMLYLGNNNFTTALMPTWIKRLPNLYLLSIDSANLIGNISADFFSSSPFLSNVTLAANSLNGTLDLSMADIALQYVNVANNQLDGFVGSNHSIEVMLGGNPFCENNETQCIALQLANSTPTQATSSQNCNSPCDNGYAINPKLPGNCQCARPVMALVDILAAMFPILTDPKLSYMEEQYVNGLSNNTFSILESQVVLSSINAMQATVWIFPPNATSTWSPTNASLISYGIKNSGVTFPGSQGSLCKVSTYIEAPYAPRPVGNGLSARAKAIIAIVVVALAVLAFVVSLYAVKQTKRANMAEKANKLFASWISAKKRGSAHIPQGKGAQWFSLKELRECTQNFSLDNELGEGGYGKVYKGHLISGEKVAIKRARFDSLKGATEFKNEIELLSRVHHKNLVGLIGFCFEEGEQMLVYEFMAKGTLQECLLGKGGVPLNWQTRKEIALCAARGIAYLHSEANPVVIHGDIKSSNILLDENLVAKVADFGLFKLGTIDNVLEVAHPTFQVNGALGYLDPDYYLTGTLGATSDVYSFGVVLLELLTGMLPIEGTKHVASKMRMAIAQGGMREVEKSMVDPELQEYPPQALEKLVMVALACVQPSSDNRPSMSTIVKEIESLSEPPLAKLGFNPNGKYAQPRYNDLLSEQSLEYSGSFTGMERLLKPK